MTLPNSYANGRKDELTIKERLASIKWSVTVSSKYEDKNLDIDAYVGKEAVSIKSQKAYGGMVTFEIAVEDRYNGWVDGWFKTGKCDSYVINVKSRNSLYYINKQNLLDYIEDNGWDEERRNNSNIEKAQGSHRHIAGYIGLINIDRLEAAKVAKKLPC